MIVSRREWLWVLLSGMLTTILWTLAAGKEIGWDVIHHHIYLPFSFLSGRFATDLFAANTQSFQNPLGYIPFYLMVDANWPAWSIGVALASIHALCVWPLWRIAMRLWPLPEQWVIRGLAVFAGWQAPIFLINAGSSSTDPFSALLVLTALALALMPGSHYLRSLLAGMLMGLAFAIKPSNAIFLLAGLAMTLWRLTIGKIGSWRDLSFQSAGCVTAAVLVGGPWAIWLYESYGSPLFPIFNNIFRSPYAPIEAASDLRFMPERLSDLIIRLFDFASFRTYVHTEGFAPDIRPLVLAISALLAVMFWLPRVISRPSLLRQSLGSDTALLAVFIISSYIVWLLISGNSRYAIALFMLCGILLVRALDFVLPRPWSMVIAFGVIILQAAFFGADGDYRYIGRPWNARPFLDIEVPSRLVEEPMLHLSIGTPSMAGVAPYFARDGAFINVIGPLSLPTNGPLGRLLEQRLKIWKGKTRFLIRGSYKSFSNPNDTKRYRFDRIAYRFGLRFDWSDCVEIRIHLNPQEELQGGDPAQLLSCAAKPREQDDPAYADSLAMAERVFKVAESQCPRILGPTPMATDADLGAWQRRYLSSNARLTLSETEGLLMSHFRSPRLVRLGSAEDVLAGRGKSACVAWNELWVK